jgi:D-inositol-3-phosphate glycosyltransferase
VIVHNKSSFSELMNKGIHMPLVAVIPHGNYAPFVNQLPLPDNYQTINLLFFGQIKEVKGLDILLKAFAEVVNHNKNYKLVVAGRPWKTQVGKYEKLINDLELSGYVETHFRYIPDEEVEHFYAQSHIIVLPYRRIYQSGVLLLTMSYGRTAITSDLPPFSEIIEPGKNGFLFKSGSAYDLANTILNITPEQIKMTTLKATQTIRDKYNWIDIGKQTKQFYESL